MELVSNRGQDTSNLQDLPPLPQHVLLRNGHAIDTSASVWRLPSFRGAGTYYVIQWEHLEVQSSLSKRALYLVKLYLVDIASKRASTTTYSQYISFVFFNRWLISEAHPFAPLQGQVFGWQDLNERLIRAFLEWRAKHIVGTAQTLSDLRSFYAWGVARQYPDFPPATLRLLRSMRGRRTPQGHAVRFRHPVKGPFTPDEVLLIREAVKDNRGTDHDRALVMLHLELGINPYATIQLMNKDFKHFEAEEGVYYQLDVPRIKKRTVHRETKRRPISKALGKLLEKLQQGGAEDPLFYWLPKSVPQQSLADALQRFGTVAEIKSPVTGAQLKLNPRRFRYTLATHMAEEGASKYHIAEILDHSDLQNVDVYVETVSSIAEEVARATDAKLDPVVRRFLGKVVDSTEVPAFGDIPNVVVPAATPHLPLTVLNVGGVGMCGRDVRKDGLCRLFPPLSCYLCPSFAALRSGPHEELLASIEGFIQAAEGTVDARILIQLNDIRVAIREVLEQLATMARSDSGKVDTGER